MGKLVEPVINTGRKFEIFNEKREKLGTEKL